MKIELKNITKDVIKNKIVIAIFALIILCLIMTIIYMRRQYKIDNQDVSNAIHGIIIEETPFLENLKSLNGD